MKRNSEEAIGRVLRGLRNTKASAGMEYRIIEAVERRAAAQPAPWFCGSSLMYGLTLIRSYGMRPLAWGLALGGMLAILSFSYTSHRIMHQTSRIAPHPDIHDLQVLPPRARALLSGSPARAHTALVVRTPVRNLAVLRSTRAASQPAPVAPLTKEERLLLRIAHTGDPREMAMLNPEIRSQQAADTEAQFKRFVEQSSKGDQE